MTIQTNIIIDSINVLANGVLEIRQATQLIDSATNEKVGESFTRWTLNPGDSITSQDPKVQAIANATWTTEVIA